MDDWNKIKELVDKLNRETDLKYDCLIQILDEELGEKKRNELHQKSMTRFKKIKG
ncbi:hypothetical protein [Bacillus cereus]|uniref:hypothetical protein n=1 Tax=Bacillus cereus TaxID=1396 RepID=UPI0015CF71B8|nr:hypothetical protein [Bacillus cereus]